MKTIKKIATVGFEETNDALVTISPQQAGQGVTVELISTVKRQYGQHLETVILDTVKQSGYTDVHVEVRDRGAWDYALQARIMTALNRGAE